ncbi:fimbria/pilus periplasmic chaperone [Providencia stuartii]|uniref:fimbria/pilus periplasmic chaperone n=1 Tax=Providencia stuartii TaxID=588 RepID=UPI002989B1E7|nr:fimbria/pilus periplasmic chaperone [Providencia stuartii]
MSLIKSSIYYFLMFFIYNISYAGGISLDSTRIVYPLGSKQISTGVRNTSDSSVFLVQAWIEKENGEKDKNFIVTPPLFTSNPKNENSLRLFYIGPELSQDRETLFYFNVKAIPSVNKKELSEKNALILAAITRIKLFVRPDNLKVSPEKSAELLRFQLVNSNVLRIKNPTPYYITLTDIKSGNDELPSVMVSPFGFYDLSTEKKLNNKSLKYSVINDYGGVSPKLDAVFE